MDNRAAGFATLTTEPNVNSLNVMTRGRDHQ